MFGFFTSRGGASGTSATRAGLLAHAPPAEVGMEIIGREKAGKTVLLRALPRTMDRELPSGLALDDVDPLRTAAMLK